MKASELRGYNIVGVKGDAGIYQVVAIDVYHQKVKLNYPRNEWHSEIKLKPIPLTEEWLVKFGYTGYGTLGEMNFFISENGTYRVRWFGNIVHLSLKYVHQLQNLYFALTGEELTVTE